MSQMPHWSHSSGFTDRGDYFQSFDSDVLRGSWSQILVRLLVNSHHYRIGHAKGPLRHHGFVSFIKNNIRSHSHFYSHFGFIEILKPCVGLVLLAF
jgi:hypothetical protein